MKRIWQGAVYTMALLLAARAEAQIAGSADDICPPATDPCVISQAWTVTGPLLFGARTVQIVTGGRLYGDDITLTCGRLEITTGLTTNGAIEANPDNGGGIDIEAMRACSGDGSTPCLSNIVCANAGLGTCSAGNTGEIDVDGKIGGGGGYAGTANIRAAGDITLRRAVNYSSTQAGADGGNVNIESFMGSVITMGPITARSGVGAYNYSEGFGGDVEIAAALDVDLSGSIDIGGGAGDGSISIQAGRDFFVKSDISGNAGAGLYANGGHVGLAAGRDLIMLQVPGVDDVQEISSDGGGRFYFYGYGGSGNWATGSGGEQNFMAGEEIAVGPHAKIHSNGGAGANGGYLYFDAARLTVEGEIRAEGTPPNFSGDSASVGGYIYIDVSESMTLAPGALIKTASSIAGGAVYIGADGPVAINGEIDLRGFGTGQYVYSYAGEMSMGGMADVTVGGRIRSGGHYGGGTLEIDVCRLALTSTGEINHTTGSPNPRNEATDITVHESMTAAAGSKLLADAAGDGNRIEYRDPKKPPVLNGTVSPAPVLAVNRLLSGCPVCGNGEIDQGESCDDGNIMSGDGCRNDCQDEGCIAQTPGYPSTPLCDDGNACTLNDCDPVAHACDNPVSCEEGVTCTVDACAAGACTHTPDDSLCDDAEECTDDLCNTSTGCVHADLTGSACEDADFCTPSGACDDGECETGVAPHLSTGNQFKLKVKEGAANDILKATLFLPLSYFSSNPTVTGMTAVVFDQRDDVDVIMQSNLPASGWIDKNGVGQQFAYKDTLRSAKIKRNADDGTARAVIKIKGTELADASGLITLGVSLLFGTDPATDDCITADAVPCTTKGKTISCR